MSADLKVETASQWAPLRLIIGLLLGVLAVYGCYRAWGDILYIAMRDEEASQVWLVFPIMGWLIWSRKDLLAPAKLSYSLIGPALIAVGWAISWYGFSTLREALWHGGAVLVLIGAFTTVAGPDLMKRLIPALVVMVFLIPVPGMIRQQIALPLQTATASASVFAFELLGVAVNRSGNVMTYNGQDIAVAEACNGMRMIFALILVTYAFAFVTPLKPSVRALILALSPIAAIACNVIRLIPTIYLLGHSPDKWGPLFHDLSGWAMLGVAFLLLLGTVRLLQWAEVPVMQNEHHDEDADSTDPNAPLATA